MGITLIGGGLGTELSSGHLVHWLEFLIRFLLFGGGRLLLEGNEIAKDEIVIREWKRHIINTFILPKGTRRELS